MLRFGIILGQAGEAAARSPDARFLPPDFRRLAVTAAELVAIAVLYFVMAKFSLALASIHPNATPIWPPTGFALAVVLLFGYRVWPAIFVAALVTNDTTAGSLATSVAIAIGNTLEAWSAVT